MYSYVLILVLAIPLPTLFPERQWMKIQVLEQAGAHEGDRVLASGFGQDKVVNPRLLQECER